MMPNSYESAFSIFLEQQEYDAASQAIFELVRAAFLAGWRAAGGEAPQKEKIFQILPTGKQ